MRASRPNGLQRALEQRAAAQSGLLRRADLLRLGLGAKAVPYRTEGADRTAATVTALLGLPASVGSYGSNMGTGDPTDA